MPIRYDQGNCTSKDRNALGPGQMVASTGGVYRNGDSDRLAKLGGRSTFGTLGAGVAVKGLALCQFDSGGTDYLVGLTGTSLKGATPGATGTFGTTLASGLSASTVDLSATHYNNRWYLATGFDRNKVLEPDGTVRAMGMIAPQLQPTGTPSTGSGSVVRATEDADTSTGVAWANGSQGRDNPTAGALTTYASATVGSVVAGSSIHTWGWRSAASDTAAGRSLFVYWGVAGPQNSPGGGTGETPDAGIGAIVDLGARVDILIQYAVDWNGTTGTFNTLVQELGVRTASIATRVTQVPLTTGQNTTAVAVRVTFTYQAGTSTVTLRVYDTKIATSGVAAFSTTTGFYYAITEYDAVRQLESPASAATALIHFQAGDSPSSANIVTLGLLAVAQNTNSTHWRIYRTMDGGTVPGGLYLIGETPIAQIQFIDDFSNFGPTALGTHFYAVVSVTIDGGTLRYPRDTAPPKFDHVTFYRGSIIGITRDKPRTLFYSFAGRPESWPEIYVLENFPFPERDQLVCSVPCGDSLIVFGKQLAMTLDDLPRAGTGGTFNAVDIRPLRGQPGVVNQNAMCSYSVSGEPRVAWVSPFGIHETNGTTSRRLSGNMAWPPTSTQATLSTAVLAYDANRQCLVFAYDSSGAGSPDRWALFHMAPEQAGNDGLPKWTGPHYGLINRTISGIVSNTYRRWSGHTTNGIVYLEDNTATGADSSFAYAGGSDTTWPMQIQTGRMYHPEDREWAVYKANLRMADFASDAISIGWVSGRDSTGSSQTKSKTITAAGQIGKDVFIALQGEWHQVTLTHTGTALGSFLDWRFPVDVGAQAGRVA